MWYDKHLFNELPTASLSCGWLFAVGSDGTVLGPHRKLLVTVAYMRIARVPEASGNVCKNSIVEQWVIAH